MRTGRLYSGLVFLIICALPVSAADLAKIDRALAKEPQYVGKPKYCLLVFGPEANFRVWLVLDGDVLYVDRDGNGDLTAPSKRVSAHFKRNAYLVFKPGAIGTLDGKVKYNLAQLSKDEEGCDLSLRLEDGRWTRAGFDGPGRLRFADRAQDAPIIHFLGPLTLQRFEPQPGSVSSHLKPEPLVRGQDGHLAFSLGTVGLGSGTFAKYDLDTLRKQRDQRPGPPGASAEVRFANGKTITIALQPDG
jgi:hypothetical protein